MTSPGSGEIAVSPDDIYDHIARRRYQAADFFTDKPPDVPGDPDGTDPTKDATNDLTGAVQGTSHGLGHHSNNVADATERATNDYLNTDGNNATKIIGVAGGNGPAGQAAAKGLTDVGVGSIMNSVLSPVGTITGAFEQSIGGFSQAAGGFGQAGANIAGQGLNASINAGERLVDTPKPAGGGPGVGGTHAGDERGSGASQRPETRPVSGSGRPVLLRA